MRRNRYIYAVLATVTLAVVTPKSSVAAAPCDAGTIVQTSPQQLLAARRMSISEVAVNLGFSDQSHFSQAFRKMTGTIPKRYQSTC